MTLNGFRYFLISVIFLWLYVVSDIFVWLYVVSDTFLGFMRFQIFSYDFMRFWIFLLLYVVSDIFLWLHLTSNKSSHGFNWSIVLWLCVAISLMVTLTLFSVLRQLKL
jgi:hypothetical protein